MPRTGRADVTGVFSMKPNSEIQRERIRLLKGHMLVKRSAMCVAFLVFFAGIPASGAEIAKFANVVDVHLVASRDGTTRVVLFSPAVRAVSIIGKPMGGDDQVRRAFGPHDLPTELGKGLSERQKLLMAGRLAGWGFNGTGLCREFQVCNLDVEGATRVIQKGLLWATYDSTVATPMEGPFPETLRPCDVILNLQGDQYITAVPTLDVDMVTRESVAVYDRIVTISDGNPLEWGFPGELLMYKVIGGNPVSVSGLDPGRVVGVVRTGGTTVAFGYSTGSCVEYDLVTGRFGEPFRLKEGELIRLAECRRGFFVMGREGEKVFTATGKDLHHLGPESVEDIPVSYSTGNWQVTVDDEFAWLAVVEPGNGGRHSLAILSRRLDGTDWIPVARLTDIRGYAPPRVSIAPAGKAQGAGVFVSATSLDDKTAAVCHVGNPETSERGY
jgi:hypothetical protein